MARIPGLSRVTGKSASRFGSGPTIAVAILFCLWANPGAEIGITSQKGLIRCFSAHTLKRGKLTVLLAGEYFGSNDYVLRQVNAFKDTIEGGTAQIAGGHLGLGFGISDYLDFSFALPLYADALKGVKGSLASVDDGGPGDVNLGMKLQYPPYEHKPFFEMAYLGHISLPTGKHRAGLFPRHTYYIPKKDTSSESLSLYTSKNMETDMKMVWSLDFGELPWEGQKYTQVQLHLNYGVRFTGNSALDHVFLLNSGIQYDPVSFLTLFTEFSGETRLANVDKGFKIGDDPLRLTPGLSINVPIGLAIKIAVDKSLSSSQPVSLHQKGRRYFTQVIPNWNVYGSLGWSMFLVPQDKDKDGVKDNLDRCVSQPEDVDGFEDADGCPETDNDNDGIPDANDSCRNQAEDMDGFEDTDGCPEQDNDKDGIPDQMDRCPDLPEDMDGFEDGDGCNDSDNDKDGIPDSLDKCPSDAEDKDGFEDEDGCPDVDDDKDGIPDVNDKCPKEKENLNGIEDDDGCPDSKPKEIKKGRMVLKGVNFKTGSANLTAGSFAVLDQVLASLVAYPKVRVEIRGYTDNVGRRSSNERLSRKRAESVKRYLVSRGVKASRLVAMGLGPKNPIASNKTASGRAENRRIEFYRLN